MTEFELRIIQWMRDIATPFTDAVFEVITSLAEQLVLVFALILIYFFYSKKVGQNFVFTFFVGSLLNNSIKGLVGRVRPFNHELADFEPARAETATGYSFPSGHSQNAAVSYTLLSRLINKKWAKWTAGIIIGAVGISRLFLGVHYPTDVIAGIALGVGCALVGSYLHKKYEPDFQKQMVLYGLVALFFLPFVSIFWRETYEQTLPFKDFYTAYAFFLGYVIAVYFEHRFVDFDCSQPVRIRIIRCALAIVIVIGCYFGLKLAFPENSLFFDMLRYFLLSVITLGIYPIAAKKWLFFKKPNDPE